MINQNQNKIYNVERNQDKRFLISQNRQMNAINQISKITNNNFQKRPFTANINSKNRNIQINQVRNINSNPLNNINENDEIGKALLIISRELKKKDNKILELERKVMELTNKLNLITNNRTSNYNSTPKVYYFNGEENKMGGKIHPRGLSIGYTGLNNINNLQNNNYIRSALQNKPNYNSDNETFAKRYNGYDNLSHSNDKSILTYNGIQINSKRDVKNYLREVKSKIEPKKFKEFIKNIKLLSNKNNSSLNKDIIVESVRILFGEENEDLFIKFKTTIGAGK